MALYAIYCGMQDHYPLYGAVRVQSYRNGQCLDDLFEPIECFALFTSPGEGLRCAEKMAVDSPEMIPLDLETARQIALDKNLDGVALIRDVDTPPTVQFI